MLIVNANQHKDIPPRFRCPVFLFLQFRLIVILVQFMSFLKQLSSFDFFGIPVLDFSNRRV
jgi:hypothetical protein